MRAFDGKHRLFEVVIATEGEYTRAEGLALRQRFCPGATRLKSGAAGARWSPRRLRIRASAGLMERATP